jgi:hypothetical protein
MKKILFVLGLVLTIGTAGSSDLEVLSIAQTIVQGIAGLGLMVIGVV